MGLYRFLERALKDRKGKPVVLERLGDRWYGITGEELLRTVDGRAKALSSMGFRDGSLVALVMKKGIEWFVTFLSLLKIGCVVIPLDSSLGSDEVKGIVDDAEPPLAVVDEGWLDLCGVLREKTYISRVVCSKRGVFYEERGKGGVDSLDQGDVEIIVYTSGTTGGFKGVMLSSSNIEYCAEAIWKRGRLDGSEKTLTFLPFCHIYGLTCGLITMVHGGISVYISSSLKKLKEELSYVKPDIFMGVPLVYQKFKKAAVRFSEKGIGRFLGPVSRAVVGRSIKGLFSKNAILYTGGAPIQRDVLEFFESIGLPLLNGYGLTETSPVVSMETRWERKMGSVGKPIDGTEVAILNPGGDDVGEVAVKGPGVMKGYFKRSEETKKAFTNGWFLTGDLGYLDDEGYLFIVGRKKNLIVTPEGKNVSPEEIEGEIIKSRFVEEVVVKGDVITAYIYPNMEEIKEIYGDVGQDEVFRIIKDEVKRLTSHLPPYKRVKRVILRMEEFPKTYTRKIKRYKLDAE